MSRWARLCIVSILFSVSGIVISLAGYPLGSAFALIGFASAIVNMVLHKTAPSWMEVKKDA